MFTREEKRAIVLRFVSRHNYAIEDWSDKALDIFTALEAGIYGEVREEFKGEFSIEISKQQTKTGLTEIFEF